jgi:hypothetical protein
MDVEERYREKRNMLHRRKSRPDNTYISGDALSKQKIICSLHKIFCILKFRISFRI